MNCGAKCAKIILFIFNFIFFIIGAGLLGLGLWITFDKRSLVQLANKALETSDNVVSNTLTSTTSIQIGAYILIGVGAFIFVVGFCGCCGACSENKCLLGLFAACIILIIIVEIVGAILVGIYRKDINSKLKSGLMKTLSQKYIGWPKSLGKDEAISLAWDEVMVTMKCCGLNGAGDFEKGSKNASSYAARWYKDGRAYALNGKNYSGSEVKLPVSCCKFKDQKFIANGWKNGEVQKALDNDKCPIDKKDYYKTGCYDSIKDFVQKNAAILIGAVAGIIVFEIIIVLVAICVIRAIKNDYERTST